MSISEDEETALYEAFLNSRVPGLIAPAEDGDLYADLEFSGNDQGYRIWSGYLDASIILLERIVHRDLWSKNLIFPALFNFRHAMEIALKWYIWYAGGTVPKGVGHNLDALIEIFRRTADGLDEDATYICDGMLGYISEIALVDPRSITFRYAAELDGSPIKITPERWNICHLYFTISDLSIALDALSGWIDLSRNEEYQASFRKLNATTLGAGATAS